MSSFPTHLITIGMNIYEQKAIQYNVTPSYKTYALINN